jgi:hypothetical protein
MVPISNIHKVLPTIIIKSCRITLSTIPKLSNVGAIFVVIFLKIPCPFSQITVGLCNRYFCVFILFSIIISKSLQSSKAILRIIFTLMYNLVFPGFLFILNFLFHHFYIFERLDFRTVLKFQIHH